MAAHNELGAWGEQCAEEFLRRKGYVIIERDWHSGHRDIDIIALDGHVMVFVEVKARRNRVFMEPEVAVDYKKMRNLRLAANHYVNYKHIDCELRFDIVTVVGMMGSEPEIDHIENAF
ncbi:MAG: YraN family protein [Prevotella sp.]|nr:YraN family protein [Prevotella sp.]